MTLEQALTNIKLVLRSYRGTLDEHEALTESLRILEDAAKRKPE